ncbi:MAG: carboxypeptidase M32 [Clostridiales bacterium]|nr:carboxypeptidase M32 [Clostridiales bacterium]
MELNEAVAKFKENVKLLKAYYHAMGVMSYDIETVAPKNAIGGYSDTMAVFSEVTYKLTVNEDNFALLDFLAEHENELDEITRRGAEEARRGLKFMRSIPMDEYVAYQRLVNEASSVWHDAKVENDYPKFEPYLNKLVDYSVRFAKYAEPDMDPYDYWLNEYEKGFTKEVLEGYFAKVRETLVPLIRRVTEAKRPDDGFLKKNYPVWKQRIFSDELMKIMGIDRRDCGIGETEHPFTTGFNKHDVRITTHYHEDAVASSMYSVIHEGGHAIYEMGTADELGETMLASGASCGMHESQSRFYENIIGRSRAFVDLVLPKMKEIFPEELEGVTGEQFYRAINIAEPSLVRTEADELTYSMHVLIRYEIEKKLFSGELSTKDLPAEWNRLYKEYLGVDVPSDKEGCLQDSHWSGGGFGYFPSYSLGSAYGAQMLNAMKKELDVDALVRNGEISRITEWLREHIHKYGMLKDPKELLMISCGEEFKPEYYLDYLTKKFSELYGL